MKRRSLMLVLVCLLALVLSSCGGASESEDTAGAQQTMKAYIKAFARGEGEKACGLLTETARDYVSGMAGTVGAKSCEEAFVKVRQILGTSAATIVNDTTVGAVDIDGNKAKVAMTSKDGDAVADLEKVGDDWRIASLPQS